MGRRRNEATALAVPAPVGGWNAKDDWDGMKSNQAVMLRNWFPGTESVDTRRGYNQHSTGLSGQVETVAEYESGDTNQLIAASDGNLYNATTGAASLLKSGFTNARWQHVNFGGFLGLVNGDDDPQSWDGANMLDTTISGAGLDVKKLVDNEVYSSRVWYVEKNTQDVWYSPVDSIGGVLVKFPLSRAGQFGGNLVSVGTWTRDSGDGADDWIVFIMSSGEVIVYSGDPATTFAKVGVFRTAEPLSRRCTLKFGANLWILTRFGLVDLLNIMSIGEAAYDKAITDNIKNAFTDQSELFGPRFGWDLVYYPKQSMVLVNIPFNIDVYRQFVVNTRTGAWTEFTNQNAFSWSLFNENLYFGGDGIIYQADSGLDDDGAEIEADGITAFNYLRSRSRKKQMTMVMPVLKMNGKLTKNLTVGVDFKIPKEPSNSALKSKSGTPWGSPWGSPWNGAKVINTNYTAASGYGYNFAVRLKISTDKQIVKWYSNRLVYKPGSLV